MNAERVSERLRSLDPVRRTGRVTRILPTYVQADGPNLPLGALCQIEGRAVGRLGDRDFSLAEVISVDRQSISLASFDANASTFSGARVTACSEPDTVPVGDAFVGRAVDALGRPIDAGPPVRAEAYRSLDGQAASPLDRVSSKRVLETGIRAIDGLLTLGQGQRIGIFAASGVGKTSLVNQLARQVKSDRCVICLVGERGREVEALWSREVDDDVRRRTTLVAATSEQSAAMRIRAVRYALSLAEFWRARGHHVLFLLDSVTRLAMAMREIGLAAGEPPTVRAYTPSVFAALPKLVERCGALRSGGAITGIMTVLSETDDIDDPVSETMKSLLDGHLILSRSLAEQGHFPAIDVPRSISRLAVNLNSAAQRDTARAAVALLGTYDSARTLIEAGVYVKGGDTQIDRAIELRPGLVSFLRQPSGEHTPLNVTATMLSHLLAGQV